MDEHGDAPTIRISVGPAGKVGDGVNAYYVYTVTSTPIAVATTTTATTSETEPAKDTAAASAQVDRRYSDFLWLHNQLSKQCAGFIIPPLPAKVVGILQGPEFREHRRAGLERFLRKVVQHDELKNTEFFKSFIECTPVALTAAKAKAQAAALSSPSLAAVAQKTQAINSWWGKAVQRITENDHFKMLAAKAGHDIVNSDTIEDPGFEELIKYVRELHAQVRVLKAKIHAADQQNKLTAGAYCDLIESLHAIADTEAAYSEVPTSDFSAVLTLLDTRARQTDSELERFGVAVKDFSRWMVAVKNAISVREDRRLHYQAKLAANAKENERSAGFETPTPDSPSRKSSSKSPGSPTTTTTITHVHADLDAARIEFEKVHTRVVSEIARFRADKSAELRLMFAEFAALQVRNSAELNDALNTSMVQLKSPLPSRLMFSNSSRFLSQTSLSDESNQAEDEAEAAALRNKLRVRPETTDHGGVAAQPDAYADVRL